MILVFYYDCFLFFYGIFYVILSDLLETVLFLGKFYYFLELVFYFVFFCFLYVCIYWIFIYFYVFIKKTFNTNFNVFKIFYVSCLKIVQAHKNSYFYLFHPKTSNFFNLRSALNVFFYCFCLSISDSLFLKNKIFSLGVLSSQKINQNVNELTLMIQ